MGKSPREVLAENLNRLMDASRDLRTVKQLSARSGVSTGTIDRIRRHEVAAGIDNVGQLAQAFDLEPWQLMVPDLEPTNAPMLAKQDAKLRDLYLKLRSTREAIDGALQAEGNTGPGELS